jgi:NTE family protein
MQAMQHTISAPRLAAHAPDVTLEMPRNACGLIEFWQAEELIAPGRARAAVALAQAHGASGQRDAGKGG